MTTTPKDSQQFPPDSGQMNFLGPPSVVISLMTGSLLVALMGGRAVAEALTQIGIASEELLRGERLPNLHHPSDLDRSYPDPDAE